MQNENNVFTLSADFREIIAESAEVLCDVTKDAQVSKESIAQVFKTMMAEVGQITYSMWEAVREAFERAAEVRSRDNGAIDAKGAANDRWSEVTAYLREIHSLKKPAKSGEDPKSAAARMEAKREKERAEAARLAEGKSLEDLELAKIALYQTATPESIAKAKSLEKAISLVAKVEKEERKGAVSALKNGAKESFKECLDTLVESGNERGLSDLILLLKRFPADCAKRDAIQ
jgi:hypothetical protein